MAHKTVRARITGQVQGVWFRAWAREAATAKGLKGWVRNAADGSVEALFSGPADAIDAMLAVCRQGPPQARVDNVETKDADAPPDLKGFNVRR